MTFQNPNEHKDLQKLASKVRVHLGCRLKMMNKDHSQACSHFLHLYLNALQTKKKYVLFSIIKVFQM